MNSRSKLRLLTIVASGCSLGSALAQDIFEENFDHQSAATGWAGIGHYPSSTHGGFLRGIVGGTPGPVLTYDNTACLPLADGCGLSIDFFVGLASDAINPWEPISHQSGNAFPTLLLLSDNGTADTSDDWGFFSDGLLTASIDYADSLPGIPFYGDHWDTYTWNFDDGLGWSSWGNAPAEGDFSSLVSSATELRFIQGTPAQPGQPVPQVFSTALVGVDNLVVHGDCIPEPSSGLLVSLAGTLWLAGVRRRRKA